MSRIVCAVIAAALVPILGVVLFFATAAMMLLGGGDAAASCVIAPTAAASSGAALKLDSAQTSHAATIIEVGLAMHVPEQGMEVAIAVALQESHLYIYSNTAAYPESASYPHDRDGHDHDSVGVFQQRPEAGWGSVKELMDVTYSARAFYGGADGPNHGSPRGLLDVGGWQSMTLAEAAQAVQVSATPTAYAKWADQAATIVTQLSAGGSGSACSGSAASAAGAALPLGGRYRLTDGFGHRVSPIAGASTWHPAFDLQPTSTAACGAPVYAARPGTVTLSSALYLSIRTTDGVVVSYLHMFKSQRLVDVGDTVQAGQQIGVTGNVQPSTGCHLDFRVYAKGSTNPQVNALPQNPNMPGWVNPEDYLQLYGVDLCPIGWCRSA